jgi:hypothetical protein
LKTFRRDFAWVLRCALLPAMAVLFVRHVPAEPAAIQPGEHWLDNRGMHLQAHGGGITHVGDTWYWFGEDRLPDDPPGKRGVDCYSSKDLSHWEFRHQVVQLADPENLADKQGHWALERPKVFYNGPTKKFVMYVHLDGRGRL